MRALSGSGVLELWEHGMPLHPLDRGLLALSVADPSCAAGVADWPLGRRNRALLDLHASWFGPRLEAWTSCPWCGEKVELEVDARDLATSAPATEPDGTVTVDAYVFRFPTSRDLAWVMALDAPATRLLDRCRISGPDHTAWTNELLDAVEERLATADPLADTRLALRCPSCQQAWEEALDAGGFVWAEIESRARRVLWEVHTLASAYGWTESESLALGDRRRAVYLEMVHA